MTEYETAAYAVPKDGQGRAIEIKRTDWENEDEFDLPPLEAGWIYRICREEKKED